MGTPFKMNGFSGFGNSPMKQDKKKVDPDAPGTPGKPGYEPPVKRSDLDEKGKEIWDKHRERKELKSMLKEFTEGAELKRKMTKKFHPKKGPGGTRPKP